MVARTGWGSGEDGPVRTCTTCQEHQKSPALAPLHPWEWPGKPWACVHINYVAPFMGKMFLVVVDAYSKWLDVRVVPSATSANTITVLRSIFATHGLPEILVSDNGAAFTSEEFRIFLKKNAIRQVLTAPYHPASNGLAEWAVQMFKRTMKKSTTGDTETNFLVSLSLNPTLHHRSDTSRTPDGSTNSNAPTSDETLCCRSGTKLSRPTEEKS